MLFVMIIPIAVTEVGMITDSIARVLRKASYPIDVTVLGIVKDFRPLLS